MINVRVAYNLNRNSKMVHCPSTRPMFVCLREMDYVERRLKSVREPPLGSILLYLRKVDYVERRLNLYESHLWDPHFHICCQPYWSVDLWVSVIGYKGRVWAITAMIRMNMCIWIVYDWHMVFNWIMNSDMYSIMDLNLLSYYFNFV